MHSMHILYLLIPGITYPWIRPDWNFEMFTNCTCSILPSSSEELYLDYWTFRNLNQWRKSEAIFVPIYVVGMEIFWDNFVDMVDALWTWNLKDLSKARWISDIQIVPVSLHWSKLLSYHLRKTIFTSKIYQD